MTICALACLAALTISPQACLEFAAKHTWEASARAFVDNITNVRIADPKGDAVQFAARSPAFRRLIERKRLPACRGTRYKSRMTELSIDPACQFCGYRCGGARARTVRGANAAIVVACSQRTRRNQGLPETGDAAADRLVQVPRRLQQAVVDPAGRARRRRGRVFVRQPRPGRGGGGADPEHAGDHRDARRTRRCPSANAPRPMAPKWCCTIATARIVKPSPATSPAKRGATLVRPYDDPLVIAGQGTVGREIAEDMAALGVDAGYRGGAGIGRRPDRGGRNRGQGALSEGDADVRRTGSF